MARKSLSLSCLVIAIALSLQACGPRFPEAEEACGHAQNSFGERLSWKAGVPVTLYMHSSIPENFRPAVQAAMDQWNRQAGRQLLRLGGVISQNPVLREDGVSMIYWQTEWDDDRSYEQGRTFIYFNGPKIYEADVKINAKDFTFYDRPRVSGSVHLESLLIHEFGHVLGLAHVEGSRGVESVMHEYLGKSVERTELGPLDRESLSCEYK